MSASIDMKLLDRHAGNTLLRDVLESSPGPVLILDPSLQVLHANSSALQLFRPSSHPDRTLNLAEFCGAAHTYLCEIVARAIHGPGDFPGKDISVGGHAFHLIVRRGDQSWIVTLRSITEDLSRDYRLRQLERHQAILVQAMNGIEGSVIIVDMTGRIRFTNDFTRRHIGNLLQGVDIESWPQVAGFYREDGVTPLTGPWRIIPRALKGQTIINQSMVIRNELTGGAVQLRASATPILSRKNAIVGAMGWFHDVTDTRALESYRNGANEE